ncbi:HI1506-related protein [Vibrio nomapromontoriensis]|uniref:HI1506-related protein n=1 Tax=Vibrio nomapromontoriensis TaxID=2910246 RepID=UPI003D0D941E
MAAWLSLAWFPILFTGELHVMAKINLITQAITVKNLAHGGYRRAGIAFEKGDNRIEPETITTTQLEMLKQDPRLKVCDVQASPSGEQSGAVDAGALSHLVTEPLAALIEAIKQLDPSNNQHFTSSGKPQVDALAERVGQKVSASERDAAWEAMQSQTHHEGE